MQMNCTFLSELDHYRPPVYSIGGRDYILMERVYKLLQGLRPKSEGIRSELYNRENSLNFDDAVSQLLSEASRVREMKGGEESSAYEVTQPRAPTDTQSSQPTPQLTLTRKD